MGMVNKKIPIGKEGEIEQDKKQKKVGMEEEGK